MTGSFCIFKFTGVVWTHNFERVFRKKTPFSFFSGVVTDRNTDEVVQRSFLGCVKLTISDFWGRNFSGVPFLDSTISAGLLY